MARRSSSLPRQAHRPMSKKDTDCYFYYYTSECDKGDCCEFRHEPAALGTEEMCRYWQRGRCDRQNCPFRHMDIQKDRSKIKCHWETHGGCTKPHCVFLHRSRNRQRSGIGHLPNTRSSRSATARFDRQYGYVPRPPFQCVSVPVLPGRGNFTAVTAAAADYDDDDDDDDGDDDDDHFRCSSGRSQSLSNMISSLSLSPTVKPSGPVYPSTWSPRDPLDPYKLTKLQPTDREFMDVVINARKSHKGAIKTIVEILRVENHNQWKLYSSMMDAMSCCDKNVRQAPERLLWHGTSVDSLANIYANGFNRSYCGRNATAFGKGVYFATDFGYSAMHTYSPADKNRKKYIFQCRVLTGQFTVGNPSMIEPPLRPGTKFRYDSVVNDMDDPRIFVIFKDSQAYPEYLVCFKG